MNIAITRSMSAIKRGDGEQAPYYILEDGMYQDATGPNTVKHGMLGMIELYQLHFEVVQCLHKTQCRTTYKSLMQTRNMLETEINARLLVAGIKPIVKG
jgi:hypothetical protein